jgi:hypothetical protein
MRPRGDDDSGHESTNRETAWSSARPKRAEPMADQTECFGRDEDGCPWIIIRGVKVTEHHDVRLTGRCCSIYDEKELAKWNGGRFVDLVGTVGAVCKADGAREACIKVWPVQPEEIDDGKLWFNESDIGKIEMLD